jgi:hypothetical protein
MNSTNPTERVKLNRTLDVFCGKRNLWYRPIYDMDSIDGEILAKDQGKPIGLVKVKSSPCNYSTNPAVGVDKELVGFLYELGVLAGIKVALIVRFRDVSKYVRLEDIDKLPTATKTIGKRTQEQYMFPIQTLQDI